MGPHQSNTGSEGAHQPEHVDPADILRILDKHGDQRSALISILGDIQDKYRYLPQRALTIVSEETATPLVDVYAAATFYRSFSLKPKGKHIISVCLGTACHVRGAPAVAEEFQQQLGIGSGETTPDRQFTLETVNCLGACALGPVVVIDGRYFSKVRKSRVKPLIKAALTGFREAPIGQDKRIFSIEVSCPSCGHSLMDDSMKVDGRPAIGLTAAFADHRAQMGLSSLYGSYHIQSKPDVPLDTVVSFICPHCGSDLNSSDACPECGAPMGYVTVCGGGTLRICTRRGCDGRMLDLGAESEAGVSEPAESARGNIEQK